MEDENKSIDPLPDSFETEEEAGAFWDAHSTSDYENSWSPPRILSTFKIESLRYRSRKTFFKSY
jgi:hypothetical protein